MKETELELLIKWLNDQSFINWVNGENLKDILAWEEYFNANPELWEIGKRGKDLVIGIGFNPISPQASETKNKSLKNLLDQIDKNENKVIKLKQSQKTKTSRFNISHIAAALVVLFIALGFYYVYNSQPAAVILATGYGEQIKETLPDGTTVTLNANSKLTYSADQKRQVILEGEAYFDVKKKPETDQLFEVLTPDLTVTVLGTSFNVNARNDRTKVFLKEGKVDLNIEALDTSVIKMNPGDLVTYSKNKNQLEEIKNNASALENSSWKDGTLIFNEIMLPEALYEIEDIYGIQFILENAELKDKLISGGVPIHDLEITLQILTEIYGFNIRAQGKRYFVTE